MTGQRGVFRESDDADQSTDRAGPTEHEIFDVLSNRRRRYTLYALTRDDGSTIGSLAEQVAAWENDSEIADVTPAERKRVYTALQQSHLPKLERTGMVTFDPESGRVEPTGAVDDIDIYLEIVNADEIPWSQYYLFVAVIGCGLLAALWVGLPPFANVSTLVWMTLVVGLFAASALVHGYVSTRLDGPVEPPEIGRQ
ncbi:MAG: hypothetical protein ABEJ82_01640 [Haloplanus sp.]